MYYTCLNYVHLETAEEQEYYSSDYDEPDGKFENLNICVRNGTQLNPEANHTMKKEA